MNIDLFYRRIRIDPALGDAALYRDVAGVARAVYREALTAASARRAVRSGQMFSHWRQPIQSPSRTGVDFSRSLSSRTDLGQTPIQREHPLHHALLIPTLNCFFPAKDNTPPRVQKKTRQNSREHQCRNLGRSYADALAEGQTFDPQTGDNDLPCTAFLSGSRL